MSARQLLDPRWHWLREHLEEIYLAMDADEEPITLSMVSASKDGEMLSTSAVKDAGELDRRLVTDESAALQAGEDLMTKSSVSLREEV